MSLAEDLDSIRNQKRGPVLCITGAWIAGLGERDREAFRLFLADKGQITVLHRMATKNGCEASETQFRRHCRQVCTCYAGMEVAA